MAAKHTTVSPLRSLLLFLGVLSVGLFVQTTLWLVFPVADQNWWATDAAKIAAGISLTPLDITYVHPGTTILYPMAALVQYGVDPKIAVRIVMAVFAAMCTAFIALVAYRLYPARLWWLAATLILIPDLRLLHGTPPSTAASLLTVLFVLLLLYAHQERDTNNYRPLAYLGICAGILMATRFDTAAFLFFTSAPLLFLFFRARVFIPAVIAGLVFAATNPHLWARPLEYSPRKTNSKVFSMLK